MMKTLINLAVVYLVAGSLTTSVAWANKVAFSELAEDFFIAARSGDIAAIEVFMSPDWLDAMEPTVLGRFLTEHGLNDYQNVSWGNSEIANEFGELHGEFVSSTSKFPIRMVFLKLEGNWLIQGVGVLPSTPPVQLPVPDYEATLELVSFTMQEFANAVDGRDMKPFYDNASTVFRIRHGLDELEQTFGQFYGKGDFHDRISEVPGLSKPSLEDGYLIVHGGYLAAGYRTRFKLDYGEEDGAWKIFAFGLSSNPEEE